MTKLQEPPKRPTLHLTNPPPKPAKSKPLMRGWTGRVCPKCDGDGEHFDEQYGADITCGACAGTGEEYVG